MKETTINDQVDHLFRQESGKMVSVLVSIFGSKHLEMAEDVVQNTLIKALEVWKFKGLPENPQAWLYRVAKNNALDIVRREKRNENFDFSEPEHQLLTSEYTATNTIANFWEEDRIKDDFLAMIFASCHPDISIENQVTFILKTLCGFSTKEVAKAFITSEDVISKRIYRTKEYFRKNNIRPQFPGINEIEDRIDAVSSVIYLVFNEGYNSTQSDSLIRHDLIAQSMYLTKALLDNNATNLPSINALMALICFNAARVDSRISEKGDLILLADQDRIKWNQELIGAARNYLEKSVAGQRISGYHFEAFIAYEHCIAENYQSTNWKNILAYYDQLLSIKFDSVVYLNRCLVLLELNDARAALEAIQKIESDKNIQQYYLYYAALGEIYLQLNKKNKAKEALKKSILLTKSDQEKSFLNKKLESII